jgi:hypothetical protein
VRNKESVFVESFEDEIEIIDPATTALVADQSAYFKDTLLYLEGQLQRSLPVSDRPVIAHKAAIDSLPFQLRPAGQAARRLADKAPCRPLAYRFCRYGADP